MGEKKSAPREEKNPVKTEEKIEDETLIAISKKVRTYKKKLGHIEEIEKKKSSGNKINEQQEKALGGKDVIVRALQDFMDVKDALSKILSQTSKKEFESKSLLVARFVISVMQVSEALKSTDYQNKDVSSETIGTIRHLSAQISTITSGDLNSSVENALTAINGFLANESFTKSLDTIIRTYRPKETKPAPVVEESSKEGPIAAAEETKGAEEEVQQAPEVSEGPEGKGEAEEEGKFSEKSEDRTDRGRGRGFRGGRGRGRGGRGRGAYNNQGGGYRSEGAYEGDWETTGRPRGRGGRGGRGRGDYERRGNERGGNRGSPRGSPRPHTKASHE